MSTNNYNWIDDNEPEQGEYDFDLFVIGGGSGGLACSKEAAILGKKVGVCDFVVPSPQGTKWGLGGTCVNVGCIPKKLYHQGALIGETLHDAKIYGWQLPDNIQHNWQQLCGVVQDHIGSLNWAYKTELRSKTVQYFNSYAVFIDAHTIELTDIKKNKQQIRSRRFVIATGGRPKYPDIPGAREFGITSDDIFSLSNAPGKTLVVGASYVALECAGFLKGLGFDVSVMARSILLRGFDQQIAEMIGNYMQRIGIKFIKPAIPSKIEKQSDSKLVASWQDESTKQIVSETFDTILFAIGRDAETTKIGLDKAGVQVDNVTGKIPTIHERTNVPHIYAIGDILLAKPELTPVAIQAGRFLARRLYSNSRLPMDYINVPTAVFTPIEYGACGYSEEDAIKQFGEQNIDVYHSYYKPLEWKVCEHRPNNVCYTKIIVNKLDNQRVIGFHLLGPNAGEITQGFAVAIKAGATYEIFSNTIGIHPTTAEEVTDLSVTKSSGKSAEKAGC
eukprot:TRINITY_DN166_c4_g2_i1.p1 TRINITY_DN166_c4_g2~~TRINITY_DN166_c4_g2_i1.p1  ORF type:complete len:503 (+),score=289.95 TRINITY_DN166_c4_g2_i1:167-1675(+)